ncbi:MAG: acetolactate synthase large subunit [Antarcticimicrobium sp.]|uniref:acetolactate synthase large subunit n=1 Tax=Antarcticimicrobium sp. TaxID=2824147 RepID=UPI00262A2998|nr:acetolactate synthase large subunit [Antarcticimicrobium sp.]MDF1716312.1 acetolactate synthase large subunit [Antarcticimicrobium sp.]
MNGAESLVRSLLASEVEICFTNPGTSEMHFVAALDHVPGMRSVLALFEGVATGAADGYWRMARKPASTLLHLGPGLANGLANLHNAKKAGSGVVNIVGEHASSHIALDAPLTSDIEGIARPMSHWVRSSSSAADVGFDAARAVRAACTAPGQVASLILPGDTAWTMGGVVADRLAPAAPKRPGDARIEQAAQILTGPDSLLLLGGGAMAAGALEMAGRIAAKTGCGLMAEWASARTARGAGRVPVAKIPYPIDLAMEALAPYRRIVLLGARAPIGFFAYPGKPARLTHPEAEILELAGAGDDLPATLDALVQAAGAGGAAARLARPKLPDLPPLGPLTPDSIAPVIARAIPENAIVVDESVTTGRGFGPATAGAPPHDWLNNCGGSIGYGLPVSIGAAIARPGRKVLALIGDGSAMYTLQALWTLAREGLDVTVVIFANRSYQILRGELTNVGVQNPGPRAIDMLSLDRPTLGWVDMARGMGVEATRVEDTAAFALALEDGLATSGPVLIEAVM